MYWRGWNPVPQIPPRPYQMCIPLEWEDRVERQDREGLVPISRYEERMSASELAKVIDTKRDLEPCRAASLM